MQAISGGVAHADERPACSDDGVVMENEDVTPSQCELGATHMEAEVDEPSTSGRDTDERKGDRRLLKAVADQLSEMVPHSFTLEGCCNAEGTNRVFSQLDYCSPNKSFLDRDVAGQHIYLHPPFKAPYAFLKHVNECYEKAPTATSCVALIPRWTQGTFCKDQLKGWQLLFCIHGI